MDSGWIPGEIHRNPLESAGIIAGILLVFRRNSRLLRPEFRRNYCRHSPGIPPEFRAGIPLELLPAFPRYSTGIPGWNSAGIIAGIPPVFRRNYCRHSTGIIAGIPPGIPPEFRRNYCCHSHGIPPELWAGILPELLPAFPRYSRLEFH